jgi:solute carrier family 25 carnitine/acylcarnitine transporter 20/29
MSTVYICSKANYLSHIFGAPLNTHSSIRGTVKSIYASSGVKGFYRGLTPVLLRAFPVNACAYLVYESILRQLGAEKVLCLAPNFLDCCD